MNILMLNHNVAFTGGGTFYRALYLGIQLVKMGHAVTLMASSPKNILQFSKQTYEGVTIRLSPGMLPHRWRYGYDPYETIRRIQFLVSEGNPYDLVHAFDSRPGVIYPALAVQKRGARLILDWCDWFGRGGAVEERNILLVRTLLRPLETYYEEAFRLRADGATIINQPLFERAEGLGFPTLNILLLPNGSHLEGFQQPGKQAARASFNLPPEIPILGYLGSLFPKDADLLKQAFENIRTRLPETRLILMGNTKATFPDLPGVIKTGFISFEKVYQYLAACDLLLLPLSDTQANRGRWPSKISDYFASGRPVAACAVGSIEKILSESSAGVCSQPDPLSFANLICEALADPEGLLQMGLNGRRAAENRYNWATLSKNVEIFYRHILERC